MVYVINEVDGTLETAHKLHVSTKNFPGMIILPLDLNLNEYFTP